MEPGSSLLYSQVPATCPCPEPDQHSPCSPLHPTSWRSILILSSRLRLDLPSDLFPSGFPTKTLYAPLLFPIRATCPAHFMLLDLISRKIFGEYRSLSSSSCSFLYSPVTSSLLGLNILLSTLLSNTFSLCSSLNVSDQVSRPYKTGIVLVMYTYILRFIFLDSQLEYKRFRTEW